MPGARVVVSGVVQGVGFRPFCYRLAVKHNLKGYVRNLRDAGVEIVFEGRDGSIQGFIAELKSKHPPLARLDEIDVSETQSKGFGSFRIVESGGAGGGGGTIPADVCTCGRCLEDLRDWHNRRVGYEFASCIDCGPRFTSIRKLPYDRSSNSFGRFRMCGECRREYQSPEDRRFNYRSICCPKCGPRYFLLDAKSRCVKCENPTREAAKLISKGNIMGIKGIGGTHLACDAGNDSVVLRLRRRLGRPAQPFAVMSRDVANVRRYAKVSGEEAAILTSKERPIVVLDKSGSKGLSEHVSPGLHNIGVMLPYTPSHNILFDSFGGDAMIMTSANIPGEPMITENHDAKKKLSRIADFLLLHDLEIVNRCDDSVLRMNAGGPVFIRRSRGFVPQEIRLNFSSRKTVLALGGELNNTACIIKGDRAYVSQHIGDTTKLDTLNFLDGVLKHLMCITSVKRPDVVACDLHPRFNTTALAEGISKRSGAQLVRVQHHHAHLASLLAENNIDGEIVCLALDGVGYGTDGKAWGGEVLAGGYAGFSRAGHLREQRMAGGDACTRFPARMLAGILFDGVGVKEARRLLKGYSGGFKHGMKEIEVVLKQLDGSFNVHYTTSCGRVLDAAAALLGLCHERTYEGEPAMKLESAAVKGRARFDLPVAIEDGVLDTTGIIVKALELKADGKRVGDVAASVQRAISDGLAVIAVAEARKRKIDCIGVSGGVACNNFMSSYIKEKVERSNVRFVKHEKVPCGDGGISLGQAAHAARE